MFGFLRSRKPYGHDQWYVPLLSFKSNTEAFYKALEDDLKFREVQDLALERVEFREGWWFYGPSDLPAGQNLDKPR